MRGLYLFLHALWIAFATAKFTQPVSSNDDFYQLWTEGDTIDITWDAGWSWGSGEQPKLVDLFVTWFDTPKKFSQLLLANVSLAQSGNYTWKVNVPNEKIAQEPKFVLRFSQHTDPEVYDYDLPGMPSRGFILRQKEFHVVVVIVVDGVFRNIRDMPTHMQPHPYLFNVLPSNSPNSARATSGFPSNNLCTLSSNALIMMSATLGAAPALSAIYIGFANANSNANDTSVLSLPSASIVHRLRRCVISPFAAPLAPLSPSRAPSK
ncbi:hypothetical protein GRF29_1536g875301 [Pseudopithomyces chartarum]|uniref:Ser-Thr-rich glycosyl-phosphatidyl-inositol-anchored membrane family-domain-containing protein n=1 Tax=Pseudopithomyces chartarum TaxID=1892770 RepID=A0AAN6RC45_9PLEO|nr:hypothetical protein GRF29_1536g875301 [Pseudopithomyces chartarum]